MNMNGIESNPVMSRMKSNKGTINTVGPSNSQIEDQHKISNLNDSQINQSMMKENSESKTKVYKPPLRSVSSKPNKNVSSQSTSTSTTNLTNSKMNAEKNPDYSDTYLSQSNLNSKFETMDLQSERYIQPDEVKYNMNTHKQTMNQTNFVQKFAGNKILGIYEDMHKTNNINPQLLKNSNTRAFLSFGNTEKNFHNEQAGYYARKNFIPNAEKKMNLQNVQSNRSLQKNRSANNFTQPKSTNRDYLINFEDLMLLEEKLDEILYCLSMNRPMHNECFEWWNFYFNCSLSGKFEYYFKEELHKNAVRDYGNMEMLAIIICYDSSHTKALFEKIQNILKSILSLVHQNYLTMCDYFISKVSTDSLGNLWVTKLKSLVFSKMTSYKNTTNYKNSINYSYISEIKANNSCINDYIRIVLKNYNTTNKEVTNSLIQYLKNLSSLNNQILNDFFRNKIIRVTNKNASVLASQLDLKDEYGLVTAPYLKTEAIKDYTLVLDLDETLIHFKIDESDDNKGLLRLRPGIYDFLDSVSQYYELVIFTAATQDVSR